MDIATADALDSLTADIHRVETSLTGKIQRVELPEDLFIATDATKQSLFAAINRAQGR